MPLLFKKKQDLDSRSKSLLKNKETKKVKSDLCSAFAGLKEETCNTLLPNKGSVSMVKLANRSLLYTVDDVVLFFDVNERRNFFPTVNALWKCPQMLRCFEVYSPVSRFVLNGAALMLPGVVNYERLEGLEKGERVSVRVLGNPLPFAVGESCVSWEDILHGPKKGTAMNVVHMFGDELWKQSKSVVPNDGFQSGCVGPIEGYSETSEAVGGFEGDNDELMNSGKEQAAGPAEGVAESAEESNDEDDERDEIIEESKDSVDARLMIALLRSLRYLVKDKNLPMLVSSFWSLLNKSVDDPFDIKKSSHKKVGIFLSSVGKQGVLVLDELNGVSSIVSVNRLSPLLRSEGVTVANLDVWKAEYDSRCQVSSSSGDVKASDAPEKIEIVRLFKFPKTAGGLFGNARGEHGNCLRQTEVRDLVLAYASANSLQCPKDKSKVLLPRASPLGRFVLNKKKSKAGGGALKGALKRPNTTTAKALPAPTKHLARVSFNNNYCGDLKSSDEEEDEGEAVEASPREMVAGVWMGSSTGPQPPKAAVPAYKTGGWFVEKGETWRPVSLPPSKPKAAATPSAGKERQPSGAGAAANKAWPLQPLPMDLQQSDSAEDVADVEVLRKDELIKEVLLHMAEYHGIVRKSATPIVRSGPPPRIDVVLEKRMGNKARLFLSLSFFLSFSLSFLSLLSLSRSFFLYLFLLLSFFSWRDLYECGYMKPD
jgi:translation initiation factor 2D